MSDFEMFSLFNELRHTANDIGVSDHYMVSVLNEATRINREANDGVNGMARLCHAMNDLIVELS